MFSVFRDQEWVHQSAQKQKTTSLATVFLVVSKSFEKLKEEICQQCCWRDALSWDLNIVFASSQNGKNRLPFVLIQKTTSLWKYTHLVLRRTSKSQTFRVLNIIEILVFAKKFISILANISCLLWKWFVDHWISFVSFSFWHQCNAFNSSHRKFSVSFPPHFIRRYFLLSLQSVVFCQSRILVGMGPKIGLISRRLTSFKALIIEHSMALRKKNRVSRDPLVWPLASITAWSKKVKKKKRDDQHKNSLRG